MKPVSYRLPPQQTCVTGKSFCGIFSGGVCSLLDRRVVSEMSRLLSCPLSWLTLHIVLYYSWVGFVTLLLNPITLFSTRCTWDSRTRHERIVQRVDLDLNLWPSLGLLRDDVNKKTINCPLSLMYIHRGSIPFLKWQNAHVNGTFLFSCLFYSYIYWGFFIHLCVYPLCVYACIWMSVL